MTMPEERARALRFGWEFLTELQASNNLTEEQRSTIADILRYYPTGGDISQWAQVRTRETMDSIRRDPTTHSLRTKALQSAYEFFRFGLMVADNLTAAQKRQIPYVLRHFPDGQVVNT